MTSHSERTLINSVIDRIHEEYMTLFGVTSPPQIGCVYTRRHPYSLIVKLNIFFQNEEKRNIYIKIPMSNQSDVLAKKEFQVLNYYYDKFKDLGRYGVIEPVALLNDPPALITVEAPGTVFNKIIKKKARLFVSKDNMKSLSLYCKACGEWLRQFQDIKPPESDRVYDYENIKSFLGLEARRTRCYDANLINKKTDHMLSNYIEAQESSLSSLNIRLSGMHSDFILSNIAVSEEKVTALDFTGFCIAPSSRDIASFLYSLDKFLTNPMYRPSIINVLKKEFLSGYQWDSQKENEVLLNLFQLRAIFGGLLHILELVEKKFMGQIVIKRLKRLSNRLILRIVNDNQHM